MTSCGNPCACLCLKGLMAALSHTWHTLSITSLNSADSSVKERKWSQSILSQDFRQSGACGMS